jgi:hypothetical protein
VTSEQKIKPLFPLKPRKKPAQLLQHIAREQVIEDGYVFRAFDTFPLADMDTPQNDWGLEDLPEMEWLQNVHNFYSGKRTFMLGTGPSLATQQHLLAPLQHEDTWTVNRMRRWYEQGQLPFTPTHHIVTEPGPCTWWGKMIEPRYDFPEAKNRIAVNWWPVTSPGWLWCPKAPDDIQIRWQGMFGFDDDLPPLPTGWASPLTGSQLAYWMGYDTVYFLGIDTTQEGQAWDPILGRTLRPRQIRSILDCFERAAREVKRHGRQIYDCTPGGRINQEGILEYRDLEEVLHASS